MLKLNNAAVDRVNPNTEKANNMEDRSVCRMKGNSAEISILKPHYTNFCFVEVHSSTVASSDHGVGLPCGIYYDRFH